MTKAKAAILVAALRRLADPANNAPKGERRAAQAKADELVAKYGPLEEPEIEVEVEIDDTWWREPDKVCPACGQAKPASDFVWSGRWCWECRHPTSARFGW